VIVLVVTVVVVEVELKQIFDEKFLNKFLKIVCSKRTQFQEIVLVFFFLS
jgi:hypothetical protein